MNFTTEFFSSGGNRYSTRHAAACSAASLRSRALQHHQRQRDIEQHRLRRRPAQEQHRRRLLLSAEGEVRRKVVLRRLHLEHLRQLVKKTSSIPSDPHRRGACRIIDFAMA
jgi:hypothetical protein